MPKEFAQLSRCSSGMRRSNSFRDEEALCNSAGVNFISHPIQDRSVPGVRPAFPNSINSWASDCAAVHCRAGIGRSGLAALVSWTIGRGAGSARFAMLSSRARVTRS